MDQFAHEHLRQDRHDEAARLYLRMLERNSRDWVAHLGLARCYLKLYGFPKANPHFQELARLAPDEAGPAHLARAEYLVLQGEPLSKTSVWFHHAAAAYLKKKQMDDYRKVCKRAQELGMDPFPGGENRGDFTTC